MSFQIFHAIEKGHKFHGMEVHFCKLVHITVFASI